LFQWVNNNQVFFFPPAIFAVLLLQNNLTGTCSEQEEPNPSRGSWHARKVELSILNYK